MAAPNHCGGCEAPEIHEYLQHSGERVCLCHTRFKQELKELKSAITIYNISKRETECGVNVGSDCAKCSILSSLLQETVTELKSTQLTIKLLQG